jgi:hypothetical protein
MSAPGMDRGSPKMQSETAVALERAVEQAGLLSTRQQKSLCTHVGELLKLYGRLTATAKSLVYGSQRRNRRAVKTVDLLLEQFEHAGHHMRRAANTLLKLQKRAEELPPLKGISETKSTRIMINDARDAFFFHTKRARAKWGLSAEPSVTYGRDLRARRSHRRYKPGERELELRRVVGQALEQSSSLPHDRVGDLCFHIADLVVACEDFTPQVQALVVGLKRAKRNSLTLAYASSSICGELDHITYHMRHAAKLLRELQCWRKGHHKLPVQKLSPENRER